MSEPAAKSYEEEFQYGQALLSAYSERRTAEVTALLNPIDGSDATVDPQLVEKAIEATDKASGCKTTWESKLSAHFST
jgi:hypothetical protein